MRTFIIQYNNFDAVGMDNVVHVPDSATDEQVSQAVSKLNSIVETVNAALTMSGNETAFLQLMEQLASGDVVVPAELPT
ncbi:hypothetical protein [Burkholderia vietnamiensis]|uniref:hypothetical protein n=1 Tax=Burkholderia vietnamiensis TaxID=60552 RepID=UPI00104107EF|nr:hypothetical protein [Burkholderia vietnamiensis]